MSSPFDLVPAIQAAAIFQSMKIITHHGRMIRPSLCWSSDVVITMKETDPLAVSISSRNADYLRAQARNHDAQPVFLVGYDVDPPIVSFIFAMRKLHRGARSWEQAARALGFENALHSDGHGRGAMRNLVFFRTSDDLAERMFEDAE